MQKKKTSNEWPVERAKFDECIENNSRVQQSIRVSGIKKKKRKRNGGDSWDNREQAVWSVTLF